MPGKFDLPSQAILNKVYDPEAEALRTTGEEGGGAVDTELPAAAALSDTVANPTTPTVGAANLGWDGANWTRTFQYAPGDGDPASDRALLMQAANKVFNGSTWDRLRGNTTGVFVAGAVASEDADSGNPVKVGGKYNATQPTFTDGDRGDLQLAQRGELKVNLYNGTQAVNYGPDNADGVSASATNSRIQVLARNTVWNGSTWDRLSGDTTGVNAHLAPKTSGGLDIFRTLDADETEEDVKTSAGQIYGWYIYNDGAAEVYVKFYNATAANVTVGTTTPALTIPIPAGGASNIEFSHGIPFSTAISIAATTVVADNDATAPAANQVVANILYK